MGTFVRGARVGRQEEDASACDVSGLSDSLLFRNKSKTHRDDPDMIGRIVCDGRAFRLSATWRVGRDGSRYLKLHSTKLKPSS
jgi:hypothetical protein